MDLITFVTQNQGPEGVYARFGLEILILNSGFQTNMDSFEQH